MTTRKLTTALSAALLGALIIPTTASAQSVAKFYNGKDVKLLVGSGAGGGYDTYARALARHMGKYIPGKPNIVVQNMPGAGGTVMMNHLANRAQKDGSVIGAAFGQSLIEPALDKGKVTKFDSRTVNWIGNTSGQVSACFTWKSSSKVKTIEDARKTETIMSATGSSNPSAIYANIFNMLMGTKFKVVTGYTTPESTLAIERGEADGSCLAYETLVARKPTWATGPLSNHKVNWLAVVDDKESPNLPGIPPVTKYLDNADDKTVIKVLRRQLLMGRPYVAPPGVPADRLTAIRTAFLATMKDPGFLAEARKLKMFVDPSDHKAMEKVVADTYAIPAAVINKVNKTIATAKLNAKTKSTRWKGAKKKKKKK